MCVRFLRGRVVKAAWESYVNLEARSRKLWPVFRNQRLSHQQHQRPHHARLVRLRASPRYRQHRLTRQKSARTSRSTRLPPGSKRINFASNSVTSAVANNSAIQSLASIGCSPADSQDFARIFQVDDDAGRGRQNRDETSRRIDAPRSKIISTYETNALVVSGQQPVRGTSMSFSL